MVKNKSADRKQYKKYFDVIGKNNMPNSFEDLKKLKYNGSNEWNLLEDYKKSREPNMIS